MGYVQMYMCTYVCMYMSHTALVTFSGLLAFSIPSPKAESLAVPRFAAIGEREAIRRSRKARQGMESALRAYVTPTLHMRITVSRLALVAPLTL